MTSTENTDTASHPMALNGCSFSNRTVTSSAVLQARTPTPPPVTIASGQSEQDECEVTQAIRRSSLRTGSSHPAIQIHLLLLSVQVTIAGLKR